MTAPTNPDAETTPSRAVVVSDACSPSPMEEQLEDDLRIAAECIEELERQRDKAIATLRELADATRQMIRDLDDHGRRTEKVRALLARISAENIPSAGNPDENAR